MHRGNVYLLAVFLGSLNGQAQTGKPAYHFAIAVPPGTTIGNRTFMENTRSNSVEAAFNDNGEVAFSATWPDRASRTGNLTGVYTSKRVVVEEGDVIEGKMITAISDSTPGSIQINNAGAVAYIAQYAPSAAPSQRAIGVFVDRRFAENLSADFSGRFSSYLLTEDGRVVSPQSAAAMAPSNNGGAPGQPSPSGKLTNLRNVLRGLPQLNRIPVIIDGVPRPVPSSAPPAPAAQTPAAKTNGTPPPCIVSPTVPLPWEKGTPAAGPIVSKSVDGPLPIPSYQSIARGAWIAVSRTVYFTRDCKPVLAVLGDQPHGGPGLEVWSPLGLVAYLGVVKGDSCDDSASIHNGSCFSSAALSPYHFDGVPEVAFSTIDALLKSHIAINRQCQILVPAYLTSASGEPWRVLLIGTPNDPGQCGGAH